MISDLNILDTVEICITDKDLRKHYYKTKIQDISLNNTFFTMIPTSTTGRPVMFFKNQPYELFAKSKDGILLWTINFLGMEKIDNIPACKFQAQSKPQFTQRREFFRQPVSIDSIFYIPDNNTKENSEDNNIKNVKDDSTIKHYGRIIDLSGGGCAFMCNDQLILRSKIFTTFSFRGKDFEFNCEILDRIDYTNTRSDWSYKYRIKWIDPKEKVIDNLIKLVFDQQREMLNIASSKIENRYV